MAKTPRPAKKKITKEERRAKYTQRAREQRQKRDHKDIVCFKCRKRGHTVSECPSADNSASNDRQPSYGDSFCKKSICYKCGSNGHPLKLCPKLTRAEKSLFYSKSKVDYSKIILPFATCFICREKGHLSSQCKQNENGIYVKGGSCKICGSKDHLVMHCPTKEQRANDVEDSDKDEFDVEELLECDDRKVDETKIKRKRKAVTF